MDLEQEGNHGPLQHHRPVPCPAADIFAYLADFATVAEWDPGVVRPIFSAANWAAQGATWSRQASGRTLPLES